MKAVVYEKFGSPEVLELKEIKKPTPKPNEVLVRVHATTVTSADSRLRSFRVPYGFKIITRFFFGFQKPKKPILGTEFAGVIEEIGHKITTFKVGDRIFGSRDHFGCYAEYICVSENETITTIPSEMSYEAIVGVPFGALTSLVYLRDIGKIKHGQKVLINGASGCLGTYAVQLAKFYGATVTAVCSGANTELVTSIGADKVIDYTSCNFTQESELYDIIFDTIGTLAFKDCRRVLATNGRFLMAVAGVPQYLYMIWNSISSKKKLVAGVASFKPNDLNFIKKLIEDKTILPIVDKAYPISDIVEAHAYVDTGRKRGNVVITLN